MKHFLSGLVFVSGMTSLALEMCASRLLGAYFGTSLFIWGNLIGLILLYLMVGYFLGGRFADRYPHTRVLCMITAVAGISIIIIPFVCQSILTWSVTGLEQVSVGIFLGSLVGTMLLFAIPVILLGLVSPFAVRLVTSDVKKSGRVSGSLYAISTVGSILGAFLPVLWLIPTFGVRRTILIFGVVLLAASLWGLLPRWQRVSYILPAPALAILLTIALLIQMGPLKEIPHLIHEQESYYNYIQVTREPDGTRQLILNEGQAIHSVYNPQKQDILTGWYWDYFLAAPYFNKGIQPSQVKRVGIIGLAGGTVARQFTQVYNNVQIDGAEIDPAIVRVGRQYFNMNEPNLHVYTQDGRTFLAASKHTYDIVAIDAFQQPYIPFQFTTREFFTQVRNHLSSTGVVALNTGHTAKDYRLVQAFVNTLSTVFPSVYVFNVPGTINTEIMATMQPTSLDTFRANLSQFSAETTLGQLATEVLPVATRGRVDGGIVFTDDKAPIEQITDQLLLNYILQP
ncbi:spermidine synthase [Dictyobacter vulcani]|uniref:Spermidine synthase n=2 Tax=Dictyobacter vulcani TaxID=2607529 RepID=A0A5J4KYE7_9CHLR|nr:spermidine synthase [Dictyobacter vulcani]